MKVMLITLALAGQPAQQFDLLCSGEAKGINRSVSKHYRVDLAAKTWCAGDECATRDIAEVLPDLIWFQRERPKYPGDQSLLQYVDRTTGKWVLVMGPLVEEGTCAPAPFSGFPKVETKF